MIDARKIEYRLVAVSPEGTQVDLTPITTNLGWSEGDKELAAKITFRVAVRLGDQDITDILKMNGQVLVYAGESLEEVMRGNVQKMGLVETSRDFELEVEAADEAQQLRHNQDDYYFTADHSSSAILGKILSDSGAVYEIHLEDAQHEKKVYRGKYLSDMIQDVLKDLKEKTGKTYILRAKGGVIEIIERGSNEQVMDFDIETNVESVRDTFDMTSTVTKVKVVGKRRDEGHQHVDGIVEGRTDWGARQVIYSRDDKSSLEDAQKAAQKILDENGIKRVTQINAPDLPNLRKGDRIRLRSSVGEGYFFVKSIRHDAAQRKMSVDLDYDKSYSTEKGLTVYDMADTNETSSEAP